MTRPDFNHRRMHALADRLLRILRERGEAWQYQYDDDWTRAKIKANAGVRAIIDEAPQLLAETCDGILLRNAHRLLTEDDASAEGDYTRSVLSTIARADLDGTDDLLHNPRAAEEEVDDFPDADPPPSLSALIQDTANLPSLKGRRVSLTGDFVFGSRGAVQDALHRAGAMWVEWPDDGADLMVIGMFGATERGAVYPSGKLRQALARGTPPTAIAHECQLLDILAQA